MVMFVKIMTKIQSILTIFEYENFHGDRIIKNQNSLQK